MHPSDYSIKGYESRTKNLDSPTGRGIIIWIQEDIGITDFKPEEGNNFQENLWVTLTLNKNENLVFGCIYRSPNSTMDNTMALNDLIRSHDITKNPNLLIVGDFNFPGINWQVNQGNNRTDREFITACGDVYLQQMVTKPTHGRPGQNHAHSHPGTDNQRQHHHQHQCS
jgi:hypothetical protein